MNEYKEAVENLAITKSDFIFNNSSPEHAAVVLATMLKYSNNSLRIYDDNLSGDIAEKDESFYVNLDKFVTSGKNLKIVVDKVKSRENKIYKTLFGYKEKYPNTVFISLSNEDFKLKTKNIFDKNINFALGDDNSFRIEEVFENEERRGKAKCSFNSPNITQELINVFDLEFPKCQIV